MPGSEETPEQAAARFWNLVSKAEVRKLADRAPAGLPQTPEEMYPYLARRVSEAKDPEMVFLDGMRTILRNEIATERRRLVSLIALKFGADRRQLYSHLKAKGIT